MDNLSTVSTIESIRVGDRRHAIDVITQIVRITSKDGSYKFFTCRVRGNDKLMKNFTIKCWPKQFNIVHGIKSGDVVTFSKLKRVKNESRSSNTYNPSANDLNIEFVVSEYASTLILESPSRDHISNFELIRSAVDNATIIGVIDRVSILSEDDGNQWLTMIKDCQENLAEVITAEAVAALTNQRWRFTGDIVLEDGVIVIHSTEYVRQE